MTTIADAGTTITSKARLATNSHENFMPFPPFPIEFSSSLSWEIDATLN
jgi:hypothetical protein